jgi:hypothetical protein
MIELYLLKDGSKISIDNLIKVSTHTPYIFFLTINFLCKLKFFDDINFLIKKYIMMYQDNI